MDVLHWIEASLVVLGALALSIVCIRFRIGSGEYLCTDCRYNSEDLCKKIERPTAISCTSYRQGPLGAAAALPAALPNVPGVDQSPP